MNILLLTTSGFPASDANAIRQLNFASVLAKRGHRITIVSFNRPTISTDKYRSNNIEHITFKGGYFDAKKHLKEYLNNNPKPDIMFINSIPLQAFKYAKKYGNDNNIKLIHDAVEWHSLDQYNLFDFYRLITVYHRTNMINKYLIDKSFSVIAISDYLNDYFNRKEIDAVKIPIIMNINEIEFKKSQKDSKLRLFYAGSPSGKDYLKKVIESINLLNESEKNSIEFDIYGINVHELSRIVNESVHTLEEKKYLKVHGKVPHNEILERLNYADFTILVRSSVARYAKAGFPTKVVESLATGTPVILNFTSDLHKYLRDGHDCIKIDTEEPNDIASALRKALTLSNNDKIEMSLNARKTSELFFNVDQYEDMIIEFFEK